MQKAGFHKMAHMTVHRYTQTTKKMFLLDIYEGTSLHDNSKNSKHAQQMDLTDSKWCILLKVV